MTLHDPIPELDDEEEFDVTPAYYPHDFEESIRFFFGIRNGLVLLVKGVLLLAVVLVVFGAAIAIVSAIVTGASS